MRVELISRLDKWLQENRTEYYVQLLPGLTKEEVDALEQTLGVSLPTEFQELYQWRNGQISWRDLSSEDKELSSDFEVLDFIPGWALLSSDDIIYNCEVLGGLLNENEGRFTRKNWWNWRWIPFLETSNSDTQCIDFAGCFGGKPGQIIEFRHEVPERPILHASFHNWLTTVVEALERRIIDFNAFYNPKWETFYKERNPGYPIDSEAG